MTLTVNNGRGALMSKNEEFEEVLQFWFSSLPTGDPAAMARQMEWWFRCGADAEIIERFSPLLAQAFFFLPLGHSEKLANLERAVNLAEELVKDAPQEQRGMLEFSANQAPATETSSPGSTAMRSETNAGTDTDQLKSRRPAQ